MRPLVTHRSAPVTLAAAARGLAAGVPVLVESTKRGADTSERRQTHP